jgi:hypothetical protein
MTAANLMAKHRQGVSRMFNVRTSFTTAIPTKSNATTSATSMMKTKSGVTGGNSGLKGNHWWKKDIIC